MNLTTNVTKSSRLVDTIAVIFLLFLISVIFYPLTGCGCVKMSPMTKAKAQMKYLAFAIEMYMNDFGQLPIQADGAETPIELTANHPLFKILNGENPRRKIYYSGIADDLLKEKQKYFLILDANKDNTIDFSGKKINSPIYIYTNYNQKTLLDNL